MRELQYYPFGCYALRRCYTALLIALYDAAAAQAATYYIDYAGGSDAGSGTSKTTPWQHVPGMNGCSGNCASANPQPGDSIILKGGVTWPNAAFPIMWSWSG